LLRWWSILTNEQAYDPAEEERPTTRLEFVLRYRWFLLLAVGLLGAVGYVIVEGYEVPRGAKVFAAAFIAGSLMGIPAAGRIVDWLYSPPYTYLVDLDPVDSDFAIWELPPAVWRELTVEDGGELFQLRAAAPAYEVQSYNPEENRAEGTWRGTASDVELIRDRTKIAEVRGELEERAKRGMAFEVMKAGIIRSALDRILRAFVQDFEAESLYSGEAVQKAVERALDGAELSLEEERPGEGVADDGTVAEANLDGVSFVFNGDDAAEEVADAD